MFFVDTAYVNDPTKRRYNTGCDFTFSGGAVVYRFKNQLINTLSSTEEELISGVTASNSDRLSSSMIW